MLLVPASDGFFYDTLFRCRWGHPTAQKTWQMNHALGGVAEASSFIPKHALGPLSITTMR